MKKNKILSTLIMLFTLCLALSSCGKKYESVSKEQWESAVEMDFLNVTIKKTTNSTPNRIITKLEEIGNYNLICELLGK